MATTLEEELNLEKEFKEGAMRELKKAIEQRAEKGQASQTRVGKGIVNALYDNFTRNIDVWYQETLAPKRGAKPHYHRILTWLADVYKNNDTKLKVLLTMTTLNTAINMTCSPLRSTEQETGEATQSNLALIIGNSVTKEAQVEEFMNAHPDYINQWLEDGINERSKEWYRAYFARKFMEKVEGWKITQWSSMDKSALGAMLLRILIDSTNLFREVETEIARNFKKTEICKIEATSALTSIWRNNSSRLIQAAFKSCPTIIPPQDWTSFWDGGYHGELKEYSTLMRLFPFFSPDALSSLDKEYMKRLQQVDLTNIFTVLNSIQATPWKINKRVLEIVKKVIDLGGDRADIPRLEPYKGLPMLPGDPSPDELKAHKKAATALYRKEARRNGQAIRTVAIMRIAERFQDYEKIYFPHNMDFRGRIYPIPSFSPQGNGLNKGLLLFADPEPVTSDVAIRWFKIAGAEFAGIDKVSFDDCLKWVADNEMNILDSAKDPMAMIDFWGNLDSPWEFLSFCFAYEEMKEYEASHNGSIIGWKCGVPVAFDGSCSGLQHYSAILKDPIGAAAVNLKPSEKPQDIYQQVADLVYEEMKNDSMNGTVDSYFKDNPHRIKFGTKTLSQLWLVYGDGTVSRKTVKRSVMTLAYGSREYGFAQQIYDDTIKPALDEADSVFTKENKGQMARYLAKLIWKHVGTVVVKAVEGMQWLKSISALVSKTGNAINWTTPMGLPIQQPYLKTCVDVYQFRLSKTRKRFYVPRCTGDIDRRKQAAGIAPNFIHSMDASHLQYTVLTAHNRGITHFSMIHDSYGTSIEQAEQLFHIVRECFVDMYKKHDVLDEFKKEAQMYATEKLPDLPEKGDFDVIQVLDSLYAFH